MEKVLRLEISNNVSSNNLLVLKHLLFKYRIRDALKLNPQ